MISRIAFSSWIVLCAAPVVVAQDADTFFNVYNLINQNFGTGRTLVRLAFQ